MGSLKITVGYLRLCLNDRTWNFQKWLRRCFIPTFVIGRIIQDVFWVKMPCDKCGPWLVMKRLEIFVVKKLNRRCTMWMFFRVWFLPVPEAESEPTNLLQLSATLNPTNLHPQVGNSCNHGNRSDLSPLRLLGKYLPVDDGGRYLQSYARKASLQISGFAS
jgi:hypothetical protein